MEPIKKTANRVGLSEVTLRKYEQYGIVSPNVNAASGYRFYNPTDISRLLSCKKFRQCGFSLEHTAELINADDLHAVESELAKKEGEMERELVRLKLVIESMKKMRQEIANIESNLYQYRMEQRPGTYLLEFSIDKDVDREHYQRVKMWTDLLPITCVSTVEQYIERENACKSGIYGYTIKDDEIGLLEGEPGEGLIYTPPTQCLTTIVEAETNGKHLTEYIPDLVAYAKDKGLVYRDEIHCDTIICKGMGDHLCAYRKVWLLLK